MTLGKWFRAMQWTKVVFGSGHLDRFVVFEIKFLFSIYINVWHTNEHDRFHTHAFPSISIFLKGQYYEEELGGKVHLIKAPLIRFIPRTYNHRMLLSKPGSISITVAGPWDRIWTERFLDGKLRVLTWGKKEIK